MGKRGLRTAAIHGRAGRSLNHTCLRSGLDKMEDELVHINFFSLLKDEELCPMFENWLKEDYRLRQNAVKLLSSQNLLRCRFCERQANYSLKIISPFASFPPSYENYSFWKDVEEFKATTPDDQVEECAAALYEKYFSLGSEWEVNADHYQKLELKGEMPKYVRAYTTFASLVSARPL